MPKPNASISFETRLQRLETIVHELEGDQVDLAHALRLFEEGVECLRAASKELADARSQDALSAELRRGLARLSTSAARLRWLTG